MTATTALAFAAGMFAGGGGRPAPPPEPPTRFDVVIPPGQQLAVVGGRPIVALSADGRSLAYKTPNGFYVRTMSDREPRLIPGTAQGLLATPFFSPDGQWLGWYTATEIKKIAIGGGEAMRLAAVRASGVSWPEPDTILFADPSGILRLSASGGTPEPLIQAAEGEQMYGPQLLPDGSVLFSVATGEALNRWEKAQVVVQAPASSQRTVIATGGTEPRYLSGGIITYTSGARLFAVRFDLERRAVVGAAVPILDNIQIPVGMARMIATGANYDASRSGSLIYVPSGAAARSLAWVNRDGTTSGAIAGIPPGNHEDPRLSPDGRRVLVTRDGDIWIYEID